jgi:glycosyltransferase involved in cell wall biosynthesis
MPHLYRNSRFVTISNTTRDEMLENRFSKHPIEIVHSGVDRACVPGPKSAVPLISYVGRLKRYKRIDLLLRAFVRVREAYPSAKLVIAGSGDQEQTLRNLSAQLHLGDAVDIRGYVSDAEKVEILQRSWVFVTPSSMEGWGIAAIEANACGTPAITYDVPGLREAVVDGVNGLVVADETDLSAPILRVLSDSQLRGELCRGAVMRAAQFSWHATAERFLDVIMRNVAGDSFSMVRTSDHWRVVAGASAGSRSVPEHVPLVLQQVENV